MTNKYKENLRKEINTGDLKKIELAVNDLINNDVDYKQTFESAFLIESLIEKKAAVKILKILKNAGVNLQQRGSILLFKMALCKKQSNFDFLLEDFKQREVNIEEKQRVLYLTLTNMISAFPSTILEEKNVVYIDKMLDLMSNEFIEKASEAVKTIRSPVVKELLTKFDKKIIDNSMGESNVCKKNKISL